MQTDGRQTYFMGIAVLPGPLKGEFDKYVILRRPHRTKRTHFILCKPMQYKSL